ncbi:uncharacterized protein LOC143290449 isoform X2 [Babylonia areolata]|uniref:uncharacterized protein LOC143290449 isoform X2 n=1 Tax=Babylonia areolata TaxID=304850 RepID=UPI003FD36E27
MAEAERRPGKTPLRKQPEIEEVEEGGQSQSQSQNAADACVSSNNNMVDTRANSNNGEEEDQEASAEHVPRSLPLTTNGARASSDHSEAPLGLNFTMHSAELPSSPEMDMLRKDRTLKMNPSFSSKAKPLMRGKAIDDSSSVPTPEVKVITTPAPDNDDNTFEFTTPLPLLGQDGSMHRSVLQKNGSLSSDAGTSNCSLSRESSMEKISNIYKDSSGVDLEEFIKKTLVKSKKDKQMLLNLEKDFKIFVESQDQHYQLAEMCSYDRMICHRVAAFYGMDHNIDKSGKCVIVSKTKFTRIPTFSCEEYIRTAEPDDNGSEKKQMRLLKKPASMEERSRGGDKAQFSSHRTKSLEERQRHYDEKRKIIFGASSEEAQGCTVIDHVPVSSGAPCKRLSSRDWSSTDSSGYVSEDGSRLRRSMMAKSNSYGGKPTVHLSPNTRTCSLSKADSITSGSYESAPVQTKQASPDNSQSPISGSGRSSADVNSPSQGHMGCGTAGPPYTVLVATDINTIPPGSMVVNPHTLQPHTNADGTPYRYNPNDPNGLPPWLAASGGAMGGSGATTTSTPHLSHHPHPHPHQHQPATSHISYNTNHAPSSVLQPLQYSLSGQSTDLVSRFSAMEVAGPAMDASMDGQQMMALGPAPHHHQPQQQMAQPQPHLQQQQQQQQPGQLPMMVSASMQPAQQFLSSFPAGTAQGQGFYAGPQVQFVQVDAQGQCLPMTGPTTGSVQSGMVSYGQPHVIQTASALQPTAMLDQSGLAATGALYGQNVFTGTVTDNPSNGYCVPYSVVYQGTAHYPAPPSGSVAMATPASHYASPFNNGPPAAVVVPADICAHGGQPAGAPSHPSHWPACGLPAGRDRVGSRAVIPSPATARDVLHHHPAPPLRRSSPGSAHDAGVRARASGRDDGRWRRGWGCSSQW